MVPVSEAVWFRQGREYHEDFALLAEVTDGEVEHRGLELLESLQSRLNGSVDQLALEEVTRRMGWVAANTLFLEPRTRAEFRTIFIESELVLQRDPLWVAVTPDRVLERRADSVIVYRDYKGAGGWGITKRWLDQWLYAIQIHTVLKAIEEELGRKVGFGQIVGLDKGQERDGKLRHPYVWGYWDAQGDPELDYYAAKRKDLTLRPVWEYDGGILEWVKRLGPMVAEGQFSFSPPIFLNERLLADLVRTRTRREKTVKLFGKSCQVDREKRATWFEPRFNKCSPSNGTPCPYLIACHNDSVNKDPLGSGLFVPRTPHHELERIEKGV